MAHPIGKAKAARTADASFSERDILTNYISPLNQFQPLELNCNEDAAVLDFPAGKHLVFTNKGIVQGIHFLESDPPEIIAKKAIRVNMSNMAAMGAHPMGYNLFLTGGNDLSTQWFATFFSTLKEENTLFRISLLGADINKSLGPLHISISALGDVSEGMVLNRGAAQSGDRIYVTGTIGDSVHGLQVLQGMHEGLTDGDKEFLISRYQVPVPRIFLGQNLGETVHAATDISDGLLIDLQAICQASGLQAYVRKDRIPLSRPLKNLLHMHDTAKQHQMMQDVWSGGDDYELIFTASPGEGDHIEYLSKRYKVPITCIGHFGMRQETDASSNSVFLMDEDGRSIDVNYLGYEHKW